MFLNNKESTVEILRGQFEEYKATPLYARLDKTYYTWENYLGAIKKLDSYDFLDPYTQVICKEGIFLLGSVYDEDGCISYQYWDFIPYRLPTERDIKHEELTVCKVRCVVF